MKRARDARTGLWQEAGATCLVLTTPNVFARWGENLVDRINSRKDRAMARNVDRLQMQKMQYQRALSLAEQAREKRNPTLHVRRYARDLYRRSTEVTRVKIRFPVGTALADEMAESEQINARLLRAIRVRDPDLILPKAAVRELIQIYAGLSDLLQLRIGSVYSPQQFAEDYVEAARNVMKNGNFHFDGRSITVGCLRLRGQLRPGTHFSETLEIVNECFHASCFVLPEPIYFDNAVLLFRRFRREGTLNFPENTRFHLQALLSTVLDWDGPERLFEKRRLQNWILAANRLGHLPERYRHTQIQATRSPDPERRRHSAFDHGQVRREIGEKMSEILLDALTEEGFGNVISAIARKDRQELGDLRTFYFNIERFLKTLHVREVLADLTVQALRDRWK